MLDKVRKLLAKQLNIPEGKITETSKIVQDLGADSLDMLELLMSLESEFGLSISDEVAAKLITVKDVVDHIQKNKKQ